jgi:hypothetical protein
MKKTTIMFALMLGVACTASAQKTGKKKAQKYVKTEQVSNVSSDQEEKLTLTKEVYPQKEENSNLYHGLTKKLTFDRMIPPHGLEVTYDKTVHILFPASVKYVDLGSEDLMSLPARPATFPAVAPAMLPPSEPAVFTFRL